MPSDYDHTTARIAGNLLSGVAEDWLREDRRKWAVSQAVATARLIVAEVKRLGSLRELQELAADTEGPL